MADLVNVTRAEQVATVTINNPPVNALSRPVVAGLAAAVEQVREDDRARVVVVRGAGARAFVAGGDITEFVDAPDDTAEPFRNVLFALEALPKPVIAAIHGFCLGGGLELALACDFRIAANDARLGQPEVKLGLLPGGGGTQRLPRVVGLGRALLLILTGEPVTAVEACAWGLVEQVVTPEELDGAVGSLATQLADRSPHAVAVIKRLIHETRDRPLGEGLREEASAFLRCLRSDDGVEGVAAFIEKREPRWASVVS